LLAVVRLPFGLPRILEAQRDRCPCSAKVETPKFPELHLTRPRVTSIIGLSSLLDSSSPNAFAADAVKQLTPWPHVDLDLAKPGTVRQPIRPLNSAHIVDVFGIY
jgi:hypothetical protein